MTPAVDKNAQLQHCRAIVSAVPDPEIPVVTIADLGILRDVDLREDGCVEVRITPTYSGCPAMLAIRDMIAEALEQAGIFNFEIKNVLSPAWTTDWISEQGRAKMKAYGIAPPPVRVGSNSSAVEQKITLVRNAPDSGSLDMPLFDDPVVQCPRCDSRATRRISAFGSTACQEQWRCLDCHEPFDHFKCH